MSAASRASRADLPPAIAAVAEIGLGLMRRAPSARIAIVRAGGILEPDAMRPRVRALVDEEVAAAAAAVLVPLGAKEVERALKEAWGRPPGKVLDLLDDEPLALTGAAQVHRGTIDGRAVTIKVRRPGVERSVRNDLALLDVLGPPLRAAFPRLDTGAILRDAREQALDELDFEHEASTQRRLARALRSDHGVVVPRPDSELSSASVLVADFAPGETLAAGARPSDGGEAARALVAAFRAAVLEAGLVPVDPRASHVVVPAAAGGPLALLGMGVARPVDRDRAQQAIDAFAAVADDDVDAFVRCLTALDLLPADRAREAFALARELLGPLLSGPALLDAAVLRDLLERTAQHTPAFVAIATAGAVQPQDLALARMLGQLVAVLARLGATEDWAALVTGR